MSLVIELSAFLLGSATVAVAIIYGGMALARHFPSRPGGVWRRRYTLTASIGAGIGALAGVCLTFVGMAMVSGLPAPWNYLACPIGGIVGGVILGCAFLVPVAVVHAVSRFGATRPGRTSANAEDDTI